MVRSCTIFAVLLLIAGAAGAVGHFYLGLSRTDAGLLAGLVLGLAVLQSFILMAMSRGSARLAAKLDADGPTDLARKMAELERRLAALEVQVAAAQLDSDAAAEPARQDPVLRARARAELALAAATIERK